MEELDALRVSDKRLGIRVDWWEPDWMGCELLVVHDNLTVGGSYGASDTPSEGGSDGPV